MLLESVTIQYLDMYMCRGVAKGNVGKMKIEFGIACY